MKQIEQPAACALAAPVAWPCEIEEADFERGVVRLKMRCADYKVGAGLHWLHTAPPRAIPPGYKLVPIQKLIALKASIHGENYRGEDWELETISTMLHTAPEAPQPAKQSLTDEEIYECERIAAIRYHRHKNSIRGQQITPADDPQWHFARAIIAAYERKNGVQT